MTLFFPTQNINDGGIISFNYVIIDDNTSVIYHSWYIITIMLNYVWNIAISTKKP